LLFGLVWQKIGPAAAFGMGSALALLAGVMLSLLKTGQPEQAIKHA
jgi:branched-subunit amino acid ABC-type transport system permease component